MREGYGNIDWCGEKKREKKKIVCLGLIVI